MSVIGFIGSVFSPWYRWSGRKSPQNHCCINVATYGRGGRFTMTDRGARALRQTASRLEVGPSKMCWQGDHLLIEINEVSSWPLITRMRGQIRIVPTGLAQVELPLTPDDSHIWRPFAPRARIEVEIDRPGWQWTGEGYFDANFGTRALEQDFSYWTWGRFPTGNGAACFYDATRLDGSQLSAGFTFDADGTARTMPLPPKARLPRSKWAVRRETRADLGAFPRQALAMLDAPFYTRSAVSTVLDGEETTGVHEALDLRRFRSPFLKPMLATRVPRRPGWRFD
ncbi:MAG: carotenoid 1,2-hydratase [Pseudomonadota bacterium]